jgi:RNA polymerase sigma-70 factor (ECF subfamily)
MYGTRFSWNMSGIMMRQREQMDASHPDQWLDRYGDYMYRYVIARVNNEAIAEDIVQEALVSAIQSYKRFRGRSSIKTWLIAILKRKIVDYYRRSGSYQHTDDIESVANRVDGLFDDTGHWRAIPNTWTLDPGEAYQQKEFMDILYKCLANMPKRLADIFMLREFEELSTDMICDQMNISESNSWVMLYRARMQLRVCLEDNWLRDEE